MQDKNSLFCRIQAEFGIGVLASYARHGLRVYAPQPYITFVSETPSPSVSPSSSPPGSGSPSPTVAAQSASATPSLGSSPSGTASQSASPSMTGTPPSSPVLSASPSVSPTPAARAAAAAGPGDSVSRAEFVGVSVAVLISLAVLGGGLAGVYFKLQALRRQTPASGTAQEWKPHSVEMVNVLHHSVNSSGRQAGTLAGPPQAAFV